MILQEIINSVVQLTAVLIVCALVWVIFGRKTSGFRAYLGLTMPTAASMGAALLVFLVWTAATALILLFPDFLEAARGENTVAGRLRQEGFSPSLLVVILFAAVIKTGLAEEIFFRGLIGKRLINMTGFWVGNTVQAALFGAVHLLIFAVPGGPAPEPALIAFVVLVPGTAGWLMGWTNERLGNGSIAPGWLIHALGNLSSYILLAFVL